MKGKPANLPASVSARLRNLANRQGGGFELLMRRYALERLLFRLSRSKHRDRFVLKGAMLFSVWLSDPFRPTKDLDLLGFGEPTVAAIGAAEARRNRWTAIALWVIAALLLWIVWLIV